MSRTLSDIAWEIKDLWPRSHVLAEPWLDAMCNVDTLSDTYFSHSGWSIVDCFLSFSNSWKGEDARRIKTELRAMLKG